MSSSNFPPSGTSPKLTRGSPIKTPEAADRWFNSLYDTIGSLEIFPERCPLAPESEFFKVEIREIFHGRRQHKYRILFTVSKNKVHVLHVRHGARLALGETLSEE